MLFLFPAWFCPFCRLDWRDCSCIVFPLRPSNITLSICAIWRIRISTNKTSFETALQKHYHLWRIVVLWLVHLQSRSRLRMGFVKINETRKSPKDKDYSLMTTFTTTSEYFREPFEGDITFASQDKSIYHSNFDSPSPHSNFTMDVISFNNRRRHVGLNKQEYQDSKSDT